MKLAIVVNDKLMMSYDRSVELPEKQQQYLQKLDIKFEQGIQLQEVDIPSPNMEQRAKFMAFSLMEGILYQEDSMAAASMAWLANRLPDLKQLIAHVDHDGTQFELDFDHEYVENQFTVELSRTLH